MVVSLGTGTSPDKKGNDWITYFNGCINQITNREEVRGRVSKRFPRPFPYFRFEAANIGDIALDAYKDEDLTKLKQETMAYMRLPEIEKEFQRVVSTSLANLFFGEVNLSSTTERVKEAEGITKVNIMKKIIVDIRCRIDNLLPSFCKHFTIRAEQTPERDNPFALTEILADAVLPSLKKGGG